MSKPIRTLPPLTRAQWEALPDAVQRFISWEEASQAKQYDPNQKPTRYAGLIRSMQKAGKP